VLTTPVTTPLYDAHYAAHYAAKSDHRPPPSPWSASRGRLPSFSPRPSFPKAVVSANTREAHVEMRAGFRLLDTSLVADPIVEEVSGGGGLSSGATEGGDHTDHSMSAFEVKLGLGINTGAGIKDNSVSFKALGCGLQIGQRFGISVFDNEVAVDLKRLMGGNAAGGGGEGEMGGQAQGAEPPAAHAGYAVEPSCPPQSLVPDPAGKLEGEATLVCAAPSASATAPSERGALGFWPFS
jgi:hypothetical protein